MNADARTGFVGNRSYSDKCIEYAGDRLWMLKYATIISGRLHLHGNSFVNTRQGRYPCFKKT